MRRYVFSEHHGDLPNGGPVGSRPHLVLNVQNLSKWGKGGPQFFVRQFGRQIFLYPIPATAISTIEISPVVCMYSLHPPISCIMDNGYSLSVSFIYTYLLLPSIWIVFTFCSSMCNDSWSLSCISNAKIHGLAGSKVQIIVFCRAAISLLHLNFLLGSYLLITLALTRSATFTSLRRSLAPTQYLSPRKLIADWNRSPDLPTNSVVPQPLR